MLDVGPEVIGTVTVPGVELRDPELTGLDVVDLITVKLVLLLNPIVEEFVLVIVFDADECELK